MKLSMWNSFSIMLSTIKILGENKIPKATFKITRTEILLKILTLIFRTTMFRPVIPYVQMYLPGKE